MSDLRTKSKIELQEELKRFQREKMNFRFRKAAKEEVSNSRIKLVRRAVARIKTLLGEHNRRGIDA